MERNVRRGEIVVSRDEFLGFVKRMKSVFSQNYFIQTTASMNEWHKALGDIPLAKLNAAFDLYVQSNAEPPSVANIRDCAKLISTSKEFDEKEYWGEHTYWVLTDLDGHIINECISADPMDGEEVRAYFVSKGYDLNGTVLKPQDFATYRPTYAPHDPPPWEREYHKITRERVEKTFESMKKTFQGIEVEIE